MKYLYPYECEKKNLSTPGELQAAIDGNRREGRRSSYGHFDSPSVQRSPIPQSISQMPPLSLVSHVNQQQQQHHHHHRLLPPVGQLPNILPAEFEQRMLDYIKLFQPKEMARAQSPDQASKLSALNALEISRVALWNMYNPAALAASTKPCEPPADGGSRPSSDAVTKKYEDLQREHQHMLARIDTLETACEKLTEIKEAQDKQIEALIKSQRERDAESTESDTSLLQQKLTELQHTVLLLEKEKNEMSQELETMNEQILQDLRLEDQLKSVLLEVDAKNVELQMLRSTLQQMQPEHGNELNLQNASLLEQVDALEQKIISLEQNKSHNTIAAGGGPSSTVVELFGEPSCSTSQGPVEVAEIAEVTEMMN